MRQEALPERVTIGPAPRQSDPPLRRCVFNDAGHPTRLLPYHRQVQAIHPLRAGELGGHAQIEQGRVVGVLTLQADRVGLAAVGGKILGHQRGRDGAAGKRQWVG